MSSFQHLWMLDPLTYNFKVILDLEFWTCLPRLKFESKNVLFDMTLEIIEQEAHINDGKYILQDKTLFADLQKRVTLFTITVHCMLEGRRWAGLFNRLSCFD